MDSLWAAQAGNPKAGPSSSLGMTVLVRRGVRGQECRATRSESYEDGFWFKVDVPDFFYSVLNLILQGDYIGGGGLALVHNSQRVFAGDAYLSTDESFAETGVFY